MTKLIFTFLFFTSILAQAEQFKTVEYTQNKNNYHISISYPQFLSNSVPAYKKINQAIKKNIFEGGCYEDLDNSERNWQYDAIATVSAINNDYVSLRVSYDYYCGGAYPPHGYYLLNYNSKTGEKLQLEKEFGFLPYSSDAYDAEKDERRRLKLANIMAYHSPRTGCFEGMNHQEAVHEIHLWYPSIAGLTKNRKVVLRINPPHANQACSFSIYVGYEEVGFLLNDNSYLHKWIK